MLSPELKTHCEQLLSEKINEIIPLSGGDINQVYLLHTERKKFVVKINSASTFPNMFEAESKGLKHLSRSNTFSIPSSMGYGEINKTAFLILEYIDSNTQSNDFWEVFGEHLASLHQTTQPYFGFEEDNYIGSLKQYNTKKARLQNFILHNA